MYSNALNQFILDPELYPQDVVFYDSNVTIIYDRFPKSVIHLLILPRLGTLTYKSPFEILTDKPTLELLFPYVLRARLFAARYLDAVKNDRPNLPSAKDFPTLAEVGYYPGGLRPTNAPTGGQPCLDRIRSGFHAMPSMANLHIHVISLDLYSPALKRFNHYNSFTTVFFLPFDSTHVNAKYLNVLYDSDSYISPNDKNYNQHHLTSPDQYLDICHHAPLVCRFCNKKFERFNMLKQHLALEYEKWKKS